MPDTKQSEAVKCEYCGGDHAYTQCPQIMRFEYGPVDFGNGPVNILSSVTKRPMAEIILFQYMSRIPEDKQMELLEKVLIPKMLG